MKKYLAITLLTSFTVIVQAQQPNQDLSQLEDYLQLQGFNISHTQSNTNGSITHQWSGTISNVKRPVSVLFDHGVLREGMNEDVKQHIIHRLDSIHALRKQQIPRALDSIRIAFGYLAKEASESYMYEYHKNDTDTLKYSLAFGEDNETHFASHYKTIGFLYGRRVANFRYWKRFNDRYQGFEEFGTYNHAISIPNSVYDFCPFDINTFETIIQASLQELKKLKGAKIYPVYWRHDDGFNDEVGAGNLVMKTIYESDNGDNKHTGLTTGTHYFIPSKYEAEAKTLCRCLDSLAHDYVDRHPEQLYRYYFTSSFPSGKLKDIVHGPAYYPTPISYNLSCMRDGDGFHILSITTDNELWIPREWTKLKSWINGEKTYLKGMKPKD